jgi:hypothetical protein
MQPREKRAMLEILAHERIDLQLERQFDANVDLLRSLPGRGTAYVGERQLKTPLT